MGILLSKSIHWGILFSIFIISITPSSAEDKILEISCRDENFKPSQDAESKTHYFDLDFTYTKGSSHETYKISRINGEEKSSISAYLERRTLTGRKFFNSSENLPFNEIQFSDTKDFENFEKASGDATFISNDFYVSGVDGSSSDPVIRYSTGQNITTINYKTGLVQVNESVKKLKCFLRTEAADKFEDLKPDVYVFGYLLFENVETTWDWVWEIVKLSFGLMITLAIFGGLIAWFVNHARQDELKICAWCGERHGLKYASGQIGRWTWDHETKDGNQDHRFKDNERTATYESIFNCEACNAVTKFIHLHSTKPSADVKISKRILITAGDGDQSLKAKFSNWVDSL